MAGKRTGKGKRISVRYIPQGFQPGLFCFIKYPGTDNKTKAGWYFEGEAGAPPFGNINGKLCVLPVRKLVPAHPERTPGNIAQAYIAVTGFELAGLEAHGRRTIAATTALVKHQVAILLLQLL